jgi:hypothetical protein
MPINHTTHDEKNNIIAVTLFETYLSKFVLEHPMFYQTLYAKTFQAIDDYFHKDPQNNPQLQAFLSRQSSRYDLDRHLYTIFSRLEEQFPDQRSMDTLRENFSLSSADYFIKLIIDDFLVPPMESPVMMGSPTHNRTSSIDEEDSPATSLGGFFSPGHGLSRRSPYNPNRPAYMFSPENRGATEVIEDEDHEMVIYAIGIVQLDYLTEDLRQYFKNPITPARFNYYPNEESYVARWLRKHHLPVISGTSGSTEGLISRVLSLSDFTDEEKQMLIFTQACNMVANGHHSFFESMIVADHFGFKLEEKENLINFYLQCVPISILNSDEFNTFINSPLIKELLIDMPIIEETKTIFPSI